MPSRPRVSVPSPITAVSPRNAHPEGTYYVEHRTTRYWVKPSPTPSMKSDLPPVCEISVASPAISRRRTRSLDEEHAKMLHISPRAAHSMSMGGPKCPSDPPSPVRRPPSPKDKPIYFYDKDKPHYGFTNFSKHAILFKGKYYPTSEHLFQSFKFQDKHPNLAEHIRTVSDKPSMALSEARRLKPQERRDWFSVNIQKMDETLWLKFTQHEDLKQELLATGNAQLIEDSDRDAFWGIGVNRDGRNELGKALERLRTKLRST